MSLRDIEDVNLSSSIHWLDSNHQSRCSCTTRVNMELDLGESLPSQVNSDEAYLKNDDQTLANVIVQNIEVIVSSTYIDRATRTRFISYYVGVKYEEFVQTRRVQDIDEVINKQRIVLDVSSQDDEDLGGELGLLGVLLKVKYDQIGGEHNLREAIENAKEAVRLAPPNHPNSATMLNSLGNMLAMRYERTVQIADLDMAIQKAEEAVRTTPPDHPKLAAMLNNLGSNVAMRYERTRQTADIDTAIDKAEDTVRLTPPNHPDLAGRLSNLGRRQMPHL